MAQLTILTQGSAKLPLTLFIALSLGCGRSQQLGDEVDLSDGALPLLRVPRAPSPPTIDGKLDEPVWRTAARTPPFVQPRSGKPARGSAVPAALRVAYDDTHLFVAMEVLDAQASSPFLRDEEDPQLWSRASAIELMIAPGPFDDNRDYFELQIDVGGAVWDTRFDDYNAPITSLPDGGKRFGHQDWRSGVERATTKSARGYVVELALPFASLRTRRVASAPKPGDIWRMNAYSFRDGQRDSLAWSPTLGQGNFHKASRFGKLHFDR